MSTLKATNIKNVSSGTNNIVLGENGGVVISGLATVSNANITGGSITGVSTVGVTTLTVSNANITGGTITGVSTVSSTAFSVNGNAYPAAGPLSNRNLIINGAMQVAQRGTVVNAGNEYGGPDRFRFAKNDGAFTISQSTDVPSGQGFSNSWKADCTSVSGTAGLNSVIFQQRFEGQNLQQLKKGSSSAESLTVQFWIKSSKTGTYIAELYDHDNTRQISKSYTVNSADTWEHKTITFLGDTSGTLDNDNALSLELNLWLFAGSSYTSGTLSTTWTSVTNANRAVGQVNAGDNTANNIYITGVQLEVGSVATPFEHRSYGDELARCQRYCQRFSNPATIAAGGVVGSSTVAYFEIKFIQTMRAGPTLTVNTLGSIVKEGTNWYANTALVASTADAIQVTLQASQSDNQMSATNATRLGNGTDITFNAEL